NSRKPYPQFASTYVTRTDGLWHYDSAQLEIRRSAGPVTLDSNFTWANNVANYLNTYDPYHVTNNWSHDAGDRRLYFTASAARKLPIRTAPLLANWSLTAPVTAPSGQYYTPLSTRAAPANASAGYVTAPADCIGGKISAPSSTAGRYGTCGVNSLQGYPIHVGHVSLPKQIPFNERVRAVFTAQVSNVTNTPHFTTPNNNISNSNFGAYTASSAVDSYSPERLGYRQVHLKLRLEF